MNQYLPLYFVLLLAGCASHPALAHHPQSSEPAPLPAPLVTGRSIEPQSIEAQNVGSIPINMILSPDGAYAIVTDEGFRQTLWSVRTRDGRGAHSLEYPHPPTAPRNGLYYGLAFAPDGTLYAAQGANDSIDVLHLETDGKLTRRATIPTRKGDFPSGLAIDDRGRLYVANNDPRGADGLPFRIPGSVSIYEGAGDGRELGRYEFAESYGGTPNFPLSVAVLRDGSKLYVGSQRDATVYVLDTAASSHPKLLSAISTGAHPVCLLLDRAQGRLFVANAQSDTVSVVDTKTDRVTASILMRPEIARDVAGATPTGLALSPDEGTLYVTLGDMNAVGVVDVRRAALLGYLPAGWYPTAVVVSPDGQRLLVANAKGTAARLPNPPKPAGRHQSPIALLEGNVITVPVAARDSLAAQTERVLELNRLTPRQLRRGNPLADIGLQAGGITHVIYVVKENRAYDQVLGDLPQGNGDPARCIFGRQVTPNQHALAERFVLLDNFYDCGEVSGDGWTWSTQAQANEYAVRNVPYSYSSRGRSYDYEGQVDQFPVGGFPAVGPDGKSLSRDPQYLNGAKAVPDVAEAPGGHIWDLVQKHGLSFRNYGFFLSDGVTLAGQAIIPDNFPNSSDLQPGGHDLSGVSDVDFRRFDLTYPDSEGPLRLATRTKDQRYLRPTLGYGKYLAPSRFSEWRREFQQMLAKAPDGSAVPNFMTVRFCTDHTMGTNPGHHTPRSMVADNDYAVGQLVDAVSHSPIWRSTAIFIVEDDAQDGPDHVDTHRSTCYVISPWIKRASVDHTFQNTVSLIRTMELLLGLPPMCQYDATATPILDWNGKPSNDAPFEAIPPNEKVLLEINGASSPKSPISPEQHAMMEESSRMDFAHADRAPAGRLNEIIWKSVKGYGSVMPESPKGPPATVPRGAMSTDDND